MSRYSMVISCEHAGNSVPEEFSHLFMNAREELNSHLGWDPGAWQMAISIGSKFGITPVGNHITRLLIELNRSLFHPQLFSKYSQQLNKKDRDVLIHSIYLPYRDSVESLIQKSLKPVLHLSIHTFTPTWNNIERQVDIGLLFDPDRLGESDFCSHWKKVLDSDYNLKIKFNEPYLGKDDGFTTYLRSRFPDNEYLGIEVEINQKYASHPDSIKEMLIKSLQIALSPTD